MTYAADHASHASMFLRESGSWGLGLFTGICELDLGSVEPVDGRVDRIESLGVSPFLPLRKGERSTW